MASEAGVDPTALVRLLQGHRPEGWHRLLADDDALPRKAHLTKPERAEWLRFLDDDSVPHRMAVADPRLLVVPGGEEDARSRRAWPIRASDASRVT
ncbi:hypothetical protein LUW76_08200 [Actinomadura madurae]|uniref:hypothetical protein n=1 Tax=Actinomadura madurae TaxID=1993 RepID=UPI0020266280|nr:hypothetical protein [Actinomadura madurae]URM94311.1 hypothetical protein LUW76_08200 [Actinomadura madurae]